MDESVSKLTEKFANIAGKWTTYAAFGSFLLYLLGYLTLRFQLSAYGLATNLDLFDEKYVFAGCRFLVYLVAAIPNILIVVLLLAAIGYLPFRWMSVSIKDRVRSWAAAWCARPLRLPLLGIVVATIFIQFVLRRCFPLGNLLLRDQLPDQWISSVLLAGDAIQSLYFSGLLAGTLITAFIAWRTMANGDATPASRFLVGVLIFLVGVEFLFLPINYGILISTQQLPRVAEVDGIAKMPDGARSWVVWDNKDALTYFIYASPEQKMLVTVPRKDAKVEIVTYDDIYCVLFSAQHSGSRPCSR